MSIREIAAKYHNPHVWLTGSRLYGLNNEDSDYDYTGIHFDLRDMLNPFKDRERTDTYQENSITFHSAAKFARLLVKGNPNIVELVYGQPEIKSRWGEFLIHSVKPHVVTRNLAAAYMGYVSEQYRRGFKPSTPQNPQRKAQLEELGYDAKYIMHFLRLCFTLSEILLNGEYKTLSAVDRKFLMRVRSGEYAKDEIIKICEGEFESAVRRYESFAHELPSNNELRETLERVFSIWIISEIQEGA